jgi:putative FmdB family regulatory protein
VNVPIYEYQCAHCGRKVEVMQKITDEPLRVCPSCKGSLRRLISLNSFHLKGNGWYVTDYKNKGKDNREKPSEKKEVKTDKKTESTSTA